MNSKLILTIIFCMGVFSLTAQNRIIDSLRNLVKTDREDTTKVNHLNALAYAFYSIKPDTTVLIAQKAFSLSKSLRWNKGEANSYRNIGVGYMYKGDFSKGLDCFQKALTIYQQIKNKKGIAAILGNIGIVYNALGDYPKASDYYLKALKMAVEVGNKQVQANTLQNIGSIYVEQANYPKGLDYYLRALKMAQEIGNKQVQETILGNIGSIYVFIEDYPKALDYYMKSLKMAEEMGNKEVQALTLDNIGSAYEELGEYPKALDYYMKSLKMTEEKLQATDLHNIGNVYLDQGNYHTALSYFLKALKLAEETGDKNGNEHYLNSIGNVYVNQGNYLNGLEYYFKALSMSRKIGDKSDVAINLRNIGITYIKQKKYVQAKIYVDSALILSKSIGEKKVMRDNYLSLAQLDSIKGDFKTECDDYKNYIVYHDSLINDVNTKKTLQAEMNFEFARQTDSTKAEQDKLNVITTATLKKNNLLNIVAASIIILLLVVGFLIFNSIKLKRKLEKQLTIATERRRISAEMHDDLGSGLSKISLLCELLKHGAKSKNDELYLKNISESNKEMADNMGNIVWALNINYDKVEKLITYISTYAKEYFESTSIQCIVNLPENLPDISIDGETRRNVFLTVKEALHNVLKHSEATSVVIRFFLNKNLLIISIQDSGKGIGSIQNSNSGNGLINMKKRMNDVAGNFKILNHRGTTIELSFPVSI